MWLLFFYHCDIGCVSNVVTTFPFPVYECDLPNKMIFQICYNRSNTTNVTCGAVSAYPSGVPDTTPSVVMLGKTQIIYKNLPFTCHYLVNCRSCLVKNSILFFFVCIYNNKFLKHRNKTPQTYHYAPVL